MEFSDGFDRRPSSCIFQRNGRKETLLRKRYRKRITGRGTKESLSRVASGRGLCSFGGGVCDQEKGYGGHELSRVRFPNKEAVGRH